jgi:ABC-2 type transport system ATP-binding protein
MSNSGALIEVEDIRKHFGSVHALDGVSLEVQPATVLGLLGPNGAGKTTLVKILTTLFQPDGGHATVAGYDVVKDASKLRHVIGLAGQNAAIDENLTGRENLEMVGRLYHLPRGEARRRADDLLERFELGAAASRLAGTYSGGMRRRLDVGASLLGRPQVLFMDEPTTGLDPRSRIALWGIIEQLVSDGTTLMLTTQYLEEADQLSNTIVVVDDGKVIAAGTSDELKARVGGERLELRVTDPSDVQVAVDAVIALASGDPHVDAATRRITVPVTDGQSLLAEAVRRLDAAGVHVVELALRRPTLDEVFLSLTGHAAEEVVDEPPAGRRGRRQRTGSSV